MSTQFILPLAGGRKAPQYQSFTPLRPLTIRQRIAYLDNVNEIQWVHELPGFVPGRAYRLLKSTVRVMQFEQRLTLTGERHDVQLSSLEMAVSIIGEHGRPVSFMAKRPGALVADGTAIDYRFDTLLRCFYVPDVGRLHSEQLARNNVQIKPRLPQLERNIVLPSQDWAMDLREQAKNPRPLNLCWTPTMPTMKSPKLTSRSCFRVRRQSLARITR